MPDPTALAPPSAPAEPRQRWRLTFARDPVGSDQVGRAALEAWQAALAGADLPIAWLEPPSATGAGRPRIAFAAPLPAAARGEAELADLWLVERRPLWAVRDALEARLPPAHHWVRAEDVWLGAPPLAGRVVAADWRVEIVSASGESRRLDDAARRLLSVRSLPRVRFKGTTERRFDLRPLLGDIAIAPATGEPADGIIRIRTRVDPELGSGRPDEVIAALADAAAVDIKIHSTTRERLLLAGEPQPPLR